ncbi:uncharacterized protein LOC115037174 [Echeneis naucrates]|uniref:uncharacterized protein LOC115037174 n=1 Tax=Echeneis naucrates TaxID=173247 RepID=UPI0011138EE0|nr:uncharacterized protein LOC115037174 [Echeneis naucrates]
MTWVGRLFIIINIFLLILTVLDLVLCLDLLPRADDGSHRDDDLEAQVTNQTASYVMERKVGTIAIMAVILLGVGAALKKNLVALSLFLGGMVAGSLLMLKVDVTAATVRPQLERVMEEWWRSRLPLDQASDSIQDWVDGLQSAVRTIHCVFTVYNELQPAGGAITSSSLVNFVLRLFWQKKFVFTQPCFPFTKTSVRINTDVPLPLNVSLFILMPLASVLSSLMIYQIIKATNRPAAPPSTMVTLSDNPPAYHQLHNLPD